MGSGRCVNTWEWALCAHSLVQLKKATTYCWCQPRPDSTSQKQLAKDTNATSNQPEAQEEENKVAEKTKPASHESKVKHDYLTLFYMGSGRHMNTWEWALCAHSMVKLKKQS